MTWIRIGKRRGNGRQVPSAAGQYSRLRHLSRPSADALSRFAGAGHAQPAEWVPRPILGSWRSVTPGTFLPRGPCLASAAGRAELYSVVARNIWVINVQASTALHLMDRQPEGARQALSTINDVSKQALVELRSVLSVLRTAGESPAEEGGSQIPVAAIAGMTERAQPLGGTMHAGSGPGGGFRVLAWLARRGGAR